MELPCRKNNLICFMLSSPIPIYSTTSTTNQRLFQEVICSLNSLSTCVRGWSCCFSCWKVLVRFLLLFFPCFCSCVLLLQVFCSWWFWICCSCASVAFCLYPFYRVPLGMSYTLVDVQIKVFVVSKQKKISF
jgi:hypothetical protein